MKRLQRWSLTLLAMATLVTVVLLLTGWGSAAAAQVQSVFVTNTSSNPVPVAQQVATQHKRLTLEYSNGTEDDETFPAIHASLITLTGDGFGHLDWVYLESGGNVVMFLPLQPTETVVLPFPQLLPIDEVVLGSCFGSTVCFAYVNIIGS